MKTLICRDSKGKIRIANLKLTHHPKMDGEYYTITGETGLYKGKLVPRPGIYIGAGKVKRTIKEQAELEFNAIIKKYKDKGYKDIEDLGYKQLSGFDPDKVLPKEKKDQNGVLKPMLAKLIESVPKSTLSKVKEWYVSRKIDGLRAELFINQGVLHFGSRGGGMYDYPTKHIRNNPKLIEYFKQHSNLVLDGELYLIQNNKRLTLQQISGCGRLEDGPVPYLLHYYVYDIVDTGKTFEERYKVIQKFKEDLNLGFNPNRNFKDDEIMIQILPQEKIPNNEKLMWKLHDKYVSEGWEGAVLRDPTKKYEPGARQMIKLKRRKSQEFNTIGYKLGLRGVEDLVFKMKTDDNKEFLAKPVGSKEDKEALFADINNIIGKKATCTYFYLSDDGIPLQPVWEAVRLDKDI